MSFDETVSEITEQQARKLTEGSATAAAAVRMLLRKLPSLGKMPEIPRGIAGVAAGTAAGNKLAQMADTWFPGDDPKDRGIRMILQKFGEPGVRGIFEGVVDSSGWETSVDEAIDKVVTTDPAGPAEERKGLIDFVTVVPYDGPKHAHAYMRMADGTIQPLCTRVDQARLSWDMKEQLRVAHTGGRGGTRERAKPMEVKVYTFDQAIALGLIACPECLGKAGSALKPKKKKDIVEKVKDDTRKALSAAIRTGVIRDNVYLRELLRATMDELCSTHEKWLDEWAAGVTVLPDRTLAEEDAEVLVEHIMCVGKGKIEWDHRLALWAMKIWGRFSSREFTMSTWMKVGLGLAGLLGLAAAFAAVLYVAIGMGVWTFGAFGPVGPVPAFVCMIIGTLVLLSVILGISPVAGLIDFAASLVNKEWKPAHSVTQRAKELVFSVGGVLGLIFLPLIVLFGSPLLPKLAVIILILANGTALAVLENIQDDKPSASRGYKAKSADWMLKYAPLFQMGVLVWALVLFVSGPSTIKGVVPWTPVQVTAVETQLGDGIKVPVITTPDGYVVLDDALNGVESQNVLAAMTVSCPLPSDANPNPTCDTEKLVVPFGATVRVPGYVMEYVPLQSNPQEYVPHLARQRAHFLTKHLPGAGVYQNRSLLAPAVLEQGLAQVAEYELISGTEFSVEDAGVSRALFAQAKSDNASHRWTRLGYLLGALVLIAVMFVGASVLGARGQEDARGIRSLGLYSAAGIFALLVLGFALFMPIEDTFAQEYAEKVTDLRAHAEEVAEDEAALERKLEEKDRKAAFKQDQRKKYGTWWSRTFSIKSGNGDINILSSPVVMPPMQRNTQVVQQGKPQVSRASVCPTAVAGTPIYDRFSCDTWTGR